MEAHGIITKDHKLSDALKSKQCPNCNEPNKPDSKFCAKCRMVLTYDAYSETVEDRQTKENEVKNLKEQMAGNAGSTEGNSRSAKGSGQTRRSRESKLNLDFKTSAH